MTQILLFGILLNLFLILVMVTTQAWITYQQTQRITAYLDSLGEMVSDMLREAIETIKTDKEDNYANHSAKRPSTDKDG